MAEVGGSGACIASANSHGHVGSETASTTAADSHKLKILPMAPSVFDIDVASENGLLHPRRRARTPSSGKSGRCLERRRSKPRAKSSRPSAGYPSGREVPDTSVSLTSVQTLRDLQQDADDPRRQICNPHGKLRLPASPLEQSLPTPDGLAGEKRDVASCPPDSAVSQQSSKTPEVVSPTDGREESGGIHKARRRSFTRLKTPPPQSSPPIEQSVEHKETRRSRMKTPPHSRLNPMSTESTVQSYGAGASPLPPPHQCEEHQKERRRKSHGDIAAVQSREGGASSSSPNHQHAYKKGGRRRSHGDITEAQAVESFEAGASLSSPSHASDECKKEGRRRSREGVAGARRSSRASGQRHRLRARATGSTHRVCRKDKTKAVHIYCRLWPLLRTEQSLGAHGVVDAIDDRVVQLKVGACARVCFDTVVTPGTQEDIFSKCKRIVHGAIDGHSGSILSYGQTGRGKTFTMFGLDSDALDVAISQNLPADAALPELDGVFQQVSVEIFKELESKTEGPDYYCATISVMEIYGNRVINLLDEDPNRPDGLCELSQIYTDAFGAVVVEGLMEIECVEANALSTHLARALHRRSQHHAQLGTKSSDGTVAIMIKIVREDAETSDRLVGKLVLCDLAGSEQSGDGAEAERDLAALGDILESLSSDPAQAAFLLSQSQRVLVRLLQDVVVEGSQMALIIHCSASSEDEHETLRTLEYGARVGKLTNP